MRLGHAEENAMMVLGKQGLLKGVKSCKLDFCEHCVLGEQSWLKFVTAKTKQLTMKYVQLWLKKLNSAAYDADVVLDEFTYEVLRQKVA